MSGKSIEEILEKMKLQKQEKENKEKDELKRINDLREKGRQEYLRLNKMYENSLYNSNMNSSSAASGGSKPDGKVKSYIATDTTFIYPISDLNSALLNQSLYNNMNMNIITFDDIDQLYTFYSTVYENTMNSNNGNPYSVFVGTQLKDLESNVILQILNGNQNPIKIIEWELVKQLTPQSEFGEYGGTSPDNTEGYVVTYSDWNVDLTVDPTPYSTIQEFMNSIENVEFGQNIDLPTLSIGPLVDK
jgi:hypothetical protein